MVEFEVDFPDGQTRKMLVVATYAKVLPVRFRVRHRWIDGDPPPVPMLGERPEGEWSEWDDAEPDPDGTSFDTPDMQN